MREPHGQTYLEWRCAIRLYFFYCCLHLFECDLFMINCIIEDHIYIYILYSRRAMIGWTLRAWIFYIHFYSYDFLEFFCWGSSKGLLRLDVWSLTLLQLCHSYGRPVQTIWLITLCSYDFEAHKRCIYLLVDVVLTREFVV